MPAGAAIVCSAPGIDASSCCASCPFAYARTSASSGSRFIAVGEERVVREVRRRVRDRVERRARLRDRGPAADRARLRAVLRRERRRASRVLRLREADDLLARQHRDVELVAERRREALELRQELLAEAVPRARSRDRCSRRRTPPRSRARSLPRRRASPGPLAPALAHPAVTIAAAAATAAAGTIKRDMSLLCRLSPHQPGDQTGEALS